MSQSVTIIEKPSFTALVIPHTTSTMKMGKIMGPSYKKIYKKLTEQSMKPPEGTPPFTIYKNLDWASLSKKGPLSMIKMMFLKKWDIEVGIMCSESTTGEDNIMKKTVDGGNFIRAIHEGPYMKVSETYKKIMDYARSNNNSVKNYSIEFYLNDPRKVPESELKTEILVPIS